MYYIYNNSEYINLVSDIMKNEKFMKTEFCIHHGLSRMDHSLRVSYFSYIIAKRLRFDFVSCARAGLLHDFFIQEDLTDFEQKISMFVHHTKALDNASKYFDVNEKEKNIIVSHMFPVTILKIPKSLEAYLVSIVDKMVATYDFGLSFAFALKKKYDAISVSMFTFMIFCCYFNNL